MAEAAGAVVEPLLTETQAALALGLKPYFLARLRIVGGGPRFVALGLKTPRYRPSALNAWSAAREVANASEYAARDADYAAGLERLRVQAGVARPERHRAKSGSETVPA
jgi:hypothetical protein